MPKTTVLSFHAVCLDGTRDLPTLVATARRMGLTVQDDLCRMEPPPGWTWEWHDLPLMPGARRSPVPARCLLHDAKGRWRGTVCPSGTPKRLELTDLWFGTRYMTDWDEFADAETVYDRASGQYLIRFDRSADAEASSPDSAEAWLDRHYPDWRDPAAYWD